MLNGILITSNGGVARVQIDGLKDMQRIVGGWIQPIAIEVGGVEVEMYLNEEGKIIGLPRNDEATGLCRPGVDIFEGDFISGDVFIIGGVDDEGESTSIPPEVADALMSRQPV